MKKYSQILKILSWLVLALFLRFYLLHWLDNENKFIVYLAIALVFFIGVFLIRSTAEVIEKTTAVLKGRTGLAGGLLQAIGTAFPDMVIGIVAAILSLQVAATDYTRSINLAIIAASTTFGSNIYNVFHAAWCIYRQNKANKLQTKLPMFPVVNMGGTVLPFKDHKIKPPKKEINAAMEVLVYLSILTTVVAIGMVLFGKVENNPAGLGGDLYQLTKPLGLVVFLAGIAVIYLFRKSHNEQVEEEGDNLYVKYSTWRIWLDLFLSGVIILLAAESLVEGVTVFSDLSGFPFILTGIITALVGCLGEMIVIHNFTVNPQGRIGDALTGVVMDNVVTVIGAAIIALMGGIFLGGDALIIIFVIILFAMSVLMHEISEMKDDLK